MPTLAHVNLAQLGSVWILNWSLPAWGVSPAFLHVMVWAHRSNGTTGPGPSSTAAASIYGTLELID